MIDLNTIVKKVDGVSVAGDRGARRLLFASQITYENMGFLVQTLRHVNAVIAIYDPLYPSPSDPGAYITYAQIKAKPEQWSMSLGNHGWSGGLYQIDEETVSIQLFNLHRKGHLSHLDFERHRLFSHNRGDMSPSRNQEMVHRIRQIHSKISS